MEEVALRSRRFREAREPEWADLERLLAKLEKGRLQRLSDEELVALPALYRSALSSLATARAVSLDRALVDYLESLCARAYFAVYGVRVRPLAAVARFLVRDWPEAVRRLWRETLAAAVITLAGVLVGFLLVRADPEWFSAFLGAAEAQGRTPEASTADLRQTLYSTKGQSWLAVFASFLFTHNAQIAVYAFALGFAFCAPTAMLLWANGATLGALAAVFDARGLSGGFWGWILIHGTTELFAVILSGAAGFRLGLTLAFPGDRARGEALAEEGRRAATVLAGVVVMLMAAGLLEGIGRQTVTTDAARYAIGMAAGTGWLLFYYGAPAWKAARARAGRAR